MSEYDYAFYSDVGGRNKNEDFCLAKGVKKNHLFLVADGLGGYDLGDEASKLVAHYIKDDLINDDEISDDKIISSIENANKKLITQQDYMNSKMKTTIAVVLLNYGTAYFAHVGDTRIYAFHKNKVVYQSIDHSASQLAVLAGEITESEIRHHKDRNVLTRALGVAEHIKVDVFQLNLEGIDAILLCTDGFWEFVTEEDMIRTKSESISADKWLYKMRAIQLKNAPSNCDNNTAIAVMI